MKTEKKTVLITGGNSGIGRVTAIKLAMAGFSIILAGRSEKKNKIVVQEINTLVGSNVCEWLLIDLASLSSVKNCANLFLNSKRHLNILINNAGVAGTAGTTSEGFELSFGVNYLGHFLLTNLLLDRLKNTKNSRIITVSSRAHKHAKFIDWDLVTKKTVSFTGIREYAVSKLANILFNRELFRKLNGSNVSSYCLHPGVVDTNIWRELPVFFRPILKFKGMLTPEEGAKTTLYCATKAPHKESGYYYADEKIDLPTNTAQSDALACELWERSLTWTEKYI